MKYVVSLIFVISIFSTESRAFQQQDQKEVVSVSANGMATNQLLPLVESDYVKNVIFLIGDGTGLAQITTGQLNLVGSDGLLTMQTMPVTGFVKTYSADDLITDSGASGTAYSCGVKTNNQVIGMDADGKICKTILELSEQKGMNTGVVATSSVTHATPASFASHVESRYMETEIASQMLKSGAEVILGGGLEFFQHNSKDRSVREDDRDLIEESEAAGYEVLRTKQDLIAANSNKLLGLFAPDGMERTKDEPVLSEMTRKAIEVLSAGENGFFLMVEGSQIDWGGHDNDAQYMLREIRDFDEAVKVALDFAVKDKETLVVLTADHETGGLSLVRSSENGKEIEIHWAVEDHTAIPVPLMAYGPGATEFMGWRENTYIAQKIAELLGLGNLPVILK